MCVCVSVCVNVSVADVRVDSALSLPLGLAAQVLFLCVQQADCSGDQTRARSLCAAAVAGIKAALKVRGQHLRSAPGHLTQSDRKPYRHTVPQIHGLIVTFHSQTMHYAL